MSREAERIQAIYRLLFDVATGKRVLQPSQSSPPDVYDEVSLRIYDLAETLRNLVLVSGMVPPRADVAYITPYVFVLDADSMLVDMNLRAAERLGYTRETLEHISFEALLTDDSTKRWRQFVSNTLDQPRLFAGLPLTFLSRTGLQMPLLCTVCETLHSERVFVLSVEVKLAFATPLVSHRDTSETEMEAIETLHAHIMAHLDEPLPSLATFADRLHVDATTLQDRFKRTYGKTIYQYYQQERLRKGYQLIITTRLYLKEIAYQCGFDDYINFYKAFKKAYGIAPSALLRPTPFNFP